MSLFQKQENDYGGEYKTHLFEQYKLYVDSAEKISDRRQNANNYFLTINTAFISLIGASFQCSHLSEARILAIVAGLVLCIEWGSLINSYKQLNTKKFEIIHEIENSLPLSLYNHEWETLEKGKNKEIYQPFSHIEQKVPFVYGAGYLYLLLKFFNCF